VASIGDFTRGAVKVIVSDYRYFLDEIYNMRLTQVFEFVRSAWTEWGKRNYELRPLIKKFGTDPYMTWPTALKRRGAKTAQ
jgi:hypothetical protein